MTIEQDFVLSERETSALAVAQVVAAKALLLGRVDSRTLDYKLARVLWPPLLQMHGGGLRALVGCDWVMLRSRSSV